MLGMAIKENTALQRAIDAAGGVQKLGDRIGVTAQAVSQWSKVPLQRVFAVEKATGISHEELRPDFFAHARKRR